MKPIYFSLIFIFGMGLFSSNTMAGSGDPLLGLGVACAPLGCGKYAQPGPNYEQRKKMPAFRTGRNPQSGATIKSENRSVPSGKDSVRQEAFPTR